MGYSYLHNIIMVILCNKIGPYNKYGGNPCAYLLQECGLTDEVDDY